MAIRQIDPGERSLAELLALGFSGLDGSADLGPIGEQAAAGLIGELVHEGPATEAALLTTAYGTEIYMVSEDSTTAEAMALSGVSELGGVRPDRLLAGLYAFRECEVPGHLLEVVTGLGARAAIEPVGPEGVDRARRLADRAGTSGPLLERLFAEATAVAGQIRGRVELDATGLSRAELDEAARIAERMLADEVERFTERVSGLGPMDPEGLEASPRLDGPSAEIIEFRRPGTAG